MSFEDRGEGRFRKASAGPWPRVSLPAGATGAPALQPNHRRGIQKGLVEICSAEFKLSSPAQFDREYLKF